MLSNYTSDKKCKTKNILVWLPSPLGDAVLCTPALRAIRRRFESSRICFFANNIVREALEPCNFTDKWLTQRSHSPFTTAKILEPYKFTHSILFKNSFGSALACFLAKIPSRIGYAREGRSLLLTDRLHPPRLPDGKFKPIPMIDYYLAIAAWLGADTADRALELQIDEKNSQSLREKLPSVSRLSRPIIILIPGGAYGPSKCWLPDRFAQTADWLIENYNATVIVSVAPSPLEKQIAKQICSFAKHKVISLAKIPLSLGELKSLFATAELVISNDTGPRHIAIALRRKLITLFGPNNPVWTNTDYENEIQILTDVACAPCDRPKCKKAEHICMQAITTEMVCNAAEKLLKEEIKLPSPVNKQKFMEISPSFFVDADYKDGLSRLGLTSIEAVFAFKADRDLNKKHLAKYRNRAQFEIASPPTTLFLKRYDKPPILNQLKNWLTHHSRQSSMFYDFDTANKLADAGINTPKTISYGQRWGKLLEKRSFIITEKIPGAESLERKLPGYFYQKETAENLKLRKHFIAELARFAKKFHQTGFRHRDLYLSHIFYSDNDSFYLIDLQRAFKPTLFAKRFLIKDIAQLYYSAPRKFFSKTDRLRFYLSYTDKDKPVKEDKSFIRKVISKAKKMARHDRKYGRLVPFEI